MPINLPTTIPISLFITRCHHTHITILQMPTNPFLITTFHHPIHHSSPTCLLFFLSPHVHEVSCIHGHPSSIIPLTMLTSSYPPYPPLTANLTTHNPYFHSHAQGHLHLIPFSILTYPSPPSSLSTSSYPLPISSHPSPDPFPHDHHVCLSLCHL